MATDDATPNSDRELQNVTREIAGRLSALGIRLTGDETPADLSAIQEGVEAFEREVERHGGDLMMDEGTRARASEPDDPHFALPVRNTHETVAEYVSRLARSTDDVRRHTSKE